MRRSSFGVGQMRGVVLLVLVALAWADEYSFAVLSDMHIGESSQQTQLAQEAVAAINEKVASLDIRFVVITGDISNSAQPQQMEEAKEILDQLFVPYLPVLGNHDIWTCNSTWQEEEPTGDALFAQTFAEVFKTFPYGKLVYSNAPVWDPLLNITIACQNWELQYDGTIFFGLDWNSREHVVPELGYFGSMPGCALHNYPGGTFNWLGTRLERLKDKESQIVTFHHQPFDLPIVFPGAIFAFGEEERTAIRNLYAHNHPISQYWGVIAGHMHIWWDSPAFPRQAEWTSFRQWETCACKSSAAFSIATMADGKLQSLSKHYGDGEIHTPNDCSEGEGKYLVSHKNTLESIQQALREL